MSRFSAKSMRELSDRRANPSSTDMYLRLAEKGRMEIRVAAEKGRTSVQFLATLLDPHELKSDESERAVQVAQHKAITEQLKALFEADGFTVTATGNFLLTISWGEA